jgi:hypothetical protein
MRERHRRDARRRRATLLAPMPFAPLFHAPPTINAIALVVLCVVMFMKIKYALH